MNCCCEGKDLLSTNFSKEQVDLSLLQDVLKKYKGEKGSLITVLQKTQDIYGFLPAEALRYIAASLEVKPAKLWGVATFYTQFRLTPVGKYLILLCQGTACHVNGSKQIETALCQELNIKVGETTEDGLFTLENAACLGCCSLAPVMMINGQAYGPLTPDKAVQIVRGIYTKDKLAVGEGE